METVTTCAVCGWDQGMKDHDTYVTENTYCTPHEPRTETEPDA